MSQYFNHTPQSTNVANQVENLAQEVDQAFLAVEEEIFKDNQANASIGSSIGSLDNKYIKEYVPNKGWINNYQQNLYFPRNSQESSLDLYPSYVTADLNTVSVTNLTVPSKTYTYKLNGILQSDTDFTFVDKKVVFGKAPANNESLKITYKGYNTTTPTDDNDWPFELKYNVLRIKQSDNSIVNEFAYTASGNTYTASGYNFKDLCSTFIKNVIDNNSSDLSKYVTIYSNGERINTTSIEITTSFVRFITEDILGPTIKIYVANASVGHLIECLYRLFYAHDHGSNGGNNINHGDLLGLYTNTYDSNGNPIIQYQSSTKTNYDHPQYLNREGFVSDGAIYNNSMLGDLLLASTDSSNRRNNLNANSVKLVFGEYASGHKLYFNQNDDCLWLDSISKDGLKLVVPDDKRAISINDHSFVDTQYVTSTTNNALKLTVKADNDQQLGVFRLTRKLITDNISTDDDKAKFLSYAAEYSFNLIKDTLTIADGAKISFGDPSVIDIIKLADGLHFTSDLDGVGTGAATVRFDIPITAHKASIDHLDATEIHLTENQKIVFGEEDHDATSVQSISFENNKLTVKSIEAVNFKNNGRSTGLSLDNRQFIYTSTPQGSYVADTVEPTDLYFETKRDTYFIKSGYTFVQGVTNLQNLPKSNIYCDTVVTENVSVNFDENVIKGILLNQTNKIFAQRDEQNNISTFVQSGSGLIVAASYNPTGPVINYGKITAKEFYAQGDSTSTAGFYGNVIIPANHKLTVNGLTEFNNDLIFTKPVEFKDAAVFKTLNADDITTKRLTVTEKATYEELVVKNVEVQNELRFNSMLQTNPIANSRFAGTVEFGNNVKITNDSTFIIGDSDIESTRATDGLLLSSNEVILGTNGLVAAGKILAGKGTPSGNGDTTGGFAFASSTGLPDGDTGMFAERNIDSQNDSDLVFRIDGAERLRIPKTPVNLDTEDLSTRMNDVVTVEMLLSQIQDMSSLVLDRTYPLGTVYENSLDSRNPSQILNWPDSVWRRYAVGRSLIGAEGNGITEKIESSLTRLPSLDLMTAGAKGGDYVAGLAIENLPPHDHDMGESSYHGWIGNRNGVSRDDIPNTYGTGRRTGMTGGGVPHDNLHPVVVTHIWERIG